MTKDKKGSSNSTKKPKKYLFDGIFVVVIFGLLFSLVYFVISDRDQDTPSRYKDSSGNDNINVGIDIGLWAPDFTVTDIDGKLFSLSDYKGKIVILDFMADYCSPCHQEMGELKRINEEYYNRNVRILSLGVSDAESPEQIRGNVKEAHGASWRFAAKTSTVASTYDVRLIPTIYILDEDGIIRYFTTTDDGGRGGMASYEVLKEQLELLL